MHLQRPSFQIEAYLQVLGSGHDMSPGGGGEGGTPLRPLHCPGRSSPCLCPPRLPEDTSVSASRYARSWHRVFWLCSFYELSVYIYSRDYVTISSCGMFHEDKSPVCFATFRSSEPHLVSATKLALKSAY